MPVALERNPGREVSFKNICAEVSGGIASLGSPDGRIPQAVQLCLSNPVCSRHACSSLARGWGLSLFFGLMAHAYACYMLYESTHGRTTKGRSEAVSEGQVH